MTTDTELKKSVDSRDRTQPNNASSATRGEATGRAKGEVLEAGGPEANAAGGVAGVSDEQGWGAALQSIRTMTATQAQFAEASLDQGRRVLGEAFRVAETYRAATERTANRVQALTGSYTTAARGLQSWSQECLAQFRRSAEHLAAKQQDFAQCRSPADFIRVQLDFYVGAVNDLLRTNVALFDAAAQTARDTTTSLYNGTVMTE